MKHLLTLALPLALGACVGGQGASGLHSVSSSLGAFNSLLNSAGSTASTVGRTTGIGAPPKPQPYRSAY